MTQCVIEVKQGLLGLFSQKYFELTVLSCFDNVGI
jgi:hypothetical protein